MALIKLTGKHAVGRHDFAIVDEDMVGYLSQWRWKAKPNGSGSGVYAVRNAKRNGKNVTLRMHRVVLGMDQDDPLEVDHQNHNTVDNRRTNLRPATRRQNAKNAQLIEREAVCQHCSGEFKRTVVVAHAKTPLSCDACLVGNGAGMPRSIVHFEKCVECEKTFTARRTGALFCSEACRCRARYRRSGSPAALSHSGALRACDLSPGTNFPNLGNR
jgi:hypothetical protein